MKIVILRHANLFTDNVVFCGCKLIESLFPETIKYKFTPFNSDDIIALILEIRNEQANNKIQSK